jgi:outer membrane protein OmpA-like peptidoglycan-associated protein
MQMIHRTSITPVRLGAFLGALLTLTLVGCAAPRPASSDAPMSFDQAIEFATDALAEQTQKLPTVLAKLDKRAVVLDPTLDSGSGQQTAATQRLDSAIAARVTNKFSQLEVVPFSAANLLRSPYLLTGTLTRAQANFRLNLAMIDVKSGLVVAQSSSLARPEGVDMSPLPYYRDSPILVKDKVIDGYVRTSGTAPGQKADATYLDRIATAAAINDATILYNAARYREALGAYRSAVATPAGEQIRVLNGIYLSAAKLGQATEAEEAFGRLVAYGIAYNSLGVKFLFNPGSTDFWTDPKVTSAYGMWLRQIARQSGTAKVCMDILGHTSKTGPEAVNDTLSLKRALYIKQRLASESPGMASRTKAQGMGSRNNLVGSGSDDVVDALDRRVEFAISECAR